MRVRFIAAWYDLWVGAYWDRRRRRLYLLLVPCLGIVIHFGSNTDGQNEDDDEDPEQARRRAINARIPTTDERIAAGQRYDDATGRWYTPGKQDVAW